MILIGGLNIKSVANERLTDIVSFVFKNRFLFYDTQYENIRVGNSNAGREELLGKDGVYARLWGIQEKTLGWKL